MKTDRGPVQSYCTLGRGMAALWNDFQDPVLPYHIAPVGQIISWLELNASGQQCGP